MTYPSQIGNYFLDFAFGQLHTNLQYTSDIGSTLAGLVDWAIKDTVGSALSPLGLTVFLGVEVGSVISTGSLVPGARVSTDGQSVDALVKQLCGAGKVYRETASGSKTERVRLRQR